jgi:hypothetical protein
MSQRRQPARFDSNSVGPQPRPSRFWRWPLSRVCARAAAALAVGSVALLSVGCASPTASTSFEVPASLYAAVFDAARDVLREQGFELDRVDARSGVISTAPRASAGLATPWVQHNPTLPGAASATLHPDRRMAVVSFVPLGSEQDVADLRTFDGTLLARVEAPALRLRRVGRHLDPTAIRLANWWRDPAEPEPMVLTPVEAGDELAAVLAAGIRDRMAVPAPSAP